MVQPQLHVTDQFMITRLRMFMLVHIFVDMIEKLKLNWSVVSPIEYSIACFIFDVVYIYFYKTQIACIFTASNIKSYYGNI